jgi:hypothetical protein
VAYDYAPLAATARALLAEFGQEVTLTRTTAGTYDPVTGTTSGAATDTETAYAAILPVGSNEVGQAMGEGNMIRSDDRKAIIEATDAAVSELQTLTDAAGVVWNIEVVNPVAPSGEAVIYKAILRR